MTGVLPNCNYKTLTAYGCDGNCIENNKVRYDDSFKCVCAEGNTGLNCNSG